MRNRYMTTENTIEKNCKNTVSPEQIDLQKANEDLLTINRIVTACISTLNLKEILNIALDEALKLLGLEGGTLCLKKSNNLFQIHTYRTESNFALNLLIKSGECICIENALRLEPVINWSSESINKYSTHDILNKETLKFHASFPLAYKNKCIGAICVYTKSNRVPDKSRFALLETLTANISLAIENARLYEKTAQNATLLEIKVKARTKDLEEANRKLRELDELKSMFIASMSHELRTPLNSIIGFISILLQGMAGDLNIEQRDMLGRSFDASKHLLSLISDVIDISKIEAGRIEAEKEEFQLETLVNEAVSDLMPEIQKKDISVKTIIPGAIPLKTDRRRLLQCLLNLLSNAVKFTQKGTITARVTESESSVSIYVEDTGIGINKDGITNIFNSFVRLDSPLKIKTTGTGLGLYLSKKLAVEILQGDLDVKSKYGTGSTFTITIPKEI